MPVAPRRRGRKRREENSGRAIAVGGIAVLLGLCLAVGGLARERGNADLALEQQSALALRTGAVLFVAPGGQPCRQKLIDNDTWLIRDFGAVDCDLAASRITNQKRQKWSSERAEAIRSGLSGH